MLSSPKIRSTFPLLGCAALRHLVLGVTLLLCLATSARAHTDTLDYIGTGYDDRHRNALIEFQMNRPRKLLSCGADSFGTYPTLYRSHSMKLHPVLERNTNFRVDLHESGDTTSLEHVLQDIGIFPAFSEIQTSNLPVKHD